jgi:hypothetical protein
MRFRSLIVGPERRSRQIDVGLPATVDVMPEARGRSKT